MVKTLTMVSRYIDRIEVASCSLDLSSLVSEASLLLPDEEQFDISPQDNYEDLL